MTVAKLVILLASAASFVAVNADRKVTLREHGTSHSQSHVSSRANPIQKVIELISNLEAKIIKEGEAEQKAYEEFVEWCDSGARDKRFEVKTMKSEKEKLEATIAKAKSNAEAAATSIEEQAASIATDEADLKAATEIRDKEHADFSAAEAELADAVDTLERAIGILQKHAAAGSALLQTPVSSSNFNALIKVLNAVIDTATFSGQDKQKLFSLVQSRQKEEDEEDDEAYGAPAPDAYKGHSSNIVDVLEDMKEKAENELSEARKAEMNAQHNYDMLKQSLTDEIAAANHEKKEAEADKSSAEGTQATAEGDLAQATKDLALAEDVLANLGSDCMEKASDHEVSVNGRAEELKALATAKKTIQQSTSGAEGQAYSFLQIDSLAGSHLRTTADLRNFEVVNRIKQLARDQHSSQLMQLASRIAATMRYNAASGEDPFAKVKDLITEMISRLEKEAADEAGHKAYCDEEMAKTKAKKEELTADVGKLTSKIDVAMSRSAELKTQVSELQKELADLAKSQAEMDKIREDSKAAFEQAKADLTQGIEGVEQALKVLRDYYGAEEEGSFLQQPAEPVNHQKASGAGSGIIGMLEVIESDFSKELAAEETEEDSAATKYEKMTQENKVTKAQKEQDVKYKTKEHKGLDKDVAEMSSDREGLQTELDAVMEYDTKIKDQCIAKPEPYEERKKRREAEIAGLKEALEILEGQALFLQHPRAARKLKL